MTRSSKIEGAALAAVLALVAGCGAPQAPAETGGSSPSSAVPTTPRASGSQGAAPASSPKVQQGIDAIQAKDYAKAKAVLGAARAEHPKDPQAAFYLGVAEEGLGEKKAAAAQYKQALALDSKLTEAAVNLSALLLDQNDPQGALAAARQGLKVAPKHPGLLMNQALALEATGDKQGAVKAYGEAVAAQPGNADLRYAHAELLAETGQKDEALAELHKIASSDPKLTMAMGILYGKLHAFDDCVNTLGTLLSKGPTPDAYVLRGRCHQGQKDGKSAEADYQAALKLDADFAPAHYYLGEQYRASGKKKQALAELQKAAQLGGDSALGKAAKKAANELKHGKAAHPKKR